MRRHAKLGLAMPPLHGAENLLLRQSTLNFETLHGDNVRWCRLLCFTLTDGKATCQALEMRLLPDAEGERVAPGAKVLISGATVKAGIILADARSLQVTRPPKDSKFPSSPWIGKVS